MSNTISSGGGYIPERNPRIVQPIVKGQPAQSEQQSKPEDPQVIAERERRRQILQKALMQKRKEAGEPGGEVDVEG